jgi:hypothetical protein
VTSRNLVAIAAVALFVSACGDEPGPPVGPAASASASAGAAAVSDHPSPAPVADESKPMDSPIVVDDELLGEDLENAEFEFEPTSNVFVVAYQREYLDALQNARQEKRFAAAFAKNEKAAEQETQRAAAVTSVALAPAVAATPAPHDASSPLSSAPSEPPPQVDESAILADERGQWAVSAEASSYYGGDTGAKPRYGAIQATGAPNVPQYSDHPDSWTPKSGDSPMPEWIVLDYATPVHATGVKVRQSAAPGVISKIELIDDGGTASVVWEGVDNVAYPKDTIAWFVRDFPRTDYLVKRVRLTLLTNRVWGWNEIDAVQLTGEK